MSVLDVGCGKAWLLRQWAERNGIDIVMCIGASSALGGVAPAMRWMVSALKPDGVLALGAAFANETPLPPEYADELPYVLAGTVDILRSNDLEITAVVASSLDEWDRLAFDFIMSKVRKGQYRRR